MEDTLDAADLLLSVGDTSMQRRSSRCQAAAETRRAAEAVDQQLPFGAGAARTGAGAGAGLAVGRRRKKTIPALQARSEVGQNMLSAKTYSTICGRVHAWPAARARSFDRSLCQCVSMHFRRSPTAARPMQRTMSQAGPRWALYQAAAAIRALHVHSYWFMRDCLHNANGSALHFTSVTGVQASPFSSRSATQRKTPKSGKVR